MILFLLSYSKYKKGDVFKTQCTYTFLIEITSKLLALHS